MGAGNAQLHLADVNGDGFLDVVFGDGANVQVRLNNGTGTIWTPATGSPYSVTANARITVGDFDGDGDIDIASPSNSQPIMHVLLNSGGMTPTFATSPLGALYHRNVGSINGSVFACHSGDMDGDGDLDVVYVADTPANITIL